jgi:TolB-like protein/DNA-binding winged helix-turn-helix (wHTH) protein/Tfp pilus assembly protein PilF
MLVSAGSEKLQFGEFALDVAAYELRRNGRAIRLERQPMDLLILLIERRGQLVTRSEIAGRLWQEGVFVDVETGIHTAVRKIRLALRDSTHAPAFVETIPGKGYRFIAEVRVISEATSTPAAPVSEQSANAVREASATELDGATDAQRNAGRALLPAAELPPRSRPDPRHRWAAILGLSSLALLVAVLGWSWRTAGAAAPAVTLAVLPFENLSGDPGWDYLADGLAEETIATVGQVDPTRLNVVARTSTLAYKRTTKSAAAIGSELGADYLLESSIRAEAGRLRITAKLIRVREQVQVWSESYNRAPTSMLGLQQELSAAIADQVRLRLSHEGRDSARRHTQNADAYDLYLRARHFANQRTPPTTRRAIELYEQATQLDPDYALAWAGIATALNASAINGDAAPLEIRPRVLRAATEAVRANPNLSEAHDALAYVSWSSTWDWPAAEAGFRRAVALDPRSSIAYWHLAHVLAQMGRHSEAEIAMQRARDLEPLSAMVHAMSSQVAFQGRDYSAALAHAGQALVLEPEFWIGHMMRAQALERLGEVDRALDALLIAARFSDQNSKVMSLRGYALAKVGRTREARDILETLQAASRQRYMPPYAMALIHAGLEETDAVFSSLERAYDARDVHLMFLPVDSKWDAYRADPRFASLLARCGFEGG